MSEVEPARIDCDVVITLLQMSLYDLWNVKAHGWVPERGTLEVNVIIVRRCGNCSQYCQNGECAQHLGGSSLLPFHWLANVAALPHFI